MTNQEKINILDVMIKQFIDMINDLTKKTLELMRQRDELFDNKDKGRMAPS